MKVMFDNIHRSLCWGRSDVMNCIRGKTRRIHRKSWNRSYYSTTQNARHLIVSISWEYSIASSFKGRSSMVRTLLSK